MNRYADLVFDEEELNSVNDLVCDLDSVEFESLLQEFVDYSISTGLLRYYIETRSIVPEECSHEE